MKGARKMKKDTRRNEAETRNELWASKTLQEQLELLPKDGATRQRSRILKKIG